MEPDLTPVLIDALGALGISLDDVAVARLVSFWNLVMEENRLHNLVSRKCGSDEGIVLHVADSLAALKFNLPCVGLKVLDFGSGAGFPGIPLKIARPGWEITLAEAREKKAAFLSRVTYALDLSGVRVYAHYIDEQANKPGIGDPFDLIIFRAVGSVLDIAEKALPLLQKKGFLLAYKGPGFREEMLKSYNSIIKFGLRLESIEEFTLPWKGNPKRALLLFKKAVRS
jgi:16S rRNA (guanine527-N7)-methyltransferase